MSQKEATRPVVFDEKAADERKKRELYGENYRPPTNQSARKNAAPAQNAGGDNRFARKAANLQSNVFADVEDEATR